MLLMLALLAGNAFGTDAMDHLHGRNWFETISVTSTSMVFRFKEDCTWVRGDFVCDDGASVQRYNSKDYINNHENLILSMERTMTLGGDHGRRGSVRFTPVIFKDKSNGFRLTEINYFGRRVTLIGYVSLSDADRKSVV